MSKDRALMELARAGRSPQQIAHQLDTSLTSILKVAKRLGVNLHPRPSGDAGRFKAKPR